MQSTARTEQNRDLVLTPDTYAYLQNEGKGGLISVFVGPTVINQTGQDRPVLYDVQKRKYKPCSLEESVQQFPRAEEDQYLILENPANDSKFPTEASQQASVLTKGRRVVIPGPWSEALWPGQHATVVDGHRLRSNQYLVVSIYNEEAADQNWDKAVVKAQTEAPTEDDEETSQPIQSTREGLAKPDNLSVGTRIVIRGTDVSFFIPPTGVEVLKEEGTNKYVREAVTLEQLEYAVLTDENGNREFPKGPQVVFPKPTQVFVTDSHQNRKFRPLELNTINGVHLKVTKDFEGPNLEETANSRDTRQYEEGEELFVTGRELAIFYPREEFSIIEYGKGNKKHFSTAIPKGEGRYVIDRETGVIETVKGPKMLLPDPRNQIIVRRVLSQRTVNLLYPGNNEALAYNIDLEQSMQGQPSGRSGFVSEGDYLKRATRGRSASMAYEAGTQLVSASSALESMEDAYVPEGVGDTKSGTTVRGTSYTEPRRLTLNTKYDGVPKVEVWPGYAILIIGAEGQRRVELGPKTILLDYDEEPGFMSLSTGKPKTTDQTIQTAYLCVQNNQVGDIVAFESKDHVKGTIKISLRVNFEAETAEDREKWFSVDNYVKYLTDHVRSLIAGMGKRHPVAEIKENFVNLVRDAILGTKPKVSETLTEPPRSTKRPGLVFEDNGMRVIEVEVLDLNLQDAEIADLLDEAQTNVVKGDIRLQEQQKALELTKETERINQETLEVRHKTRTVQTGLEEASVADQLKLELARIQSLTEQTEKTRQKIEADQENQNYESEQELARQKAIANQEQEIAAARQKAELELLNAKCEDAVKRMNAAKDGLHEALATLSRDEIVAKVAEATNIERFLGNGSTEGALAQVFATFPAIKEFLDRATESQNQRLGHNRLQPTE